jgi:hypothetical protein
MRATRAKVEQSNRPDTAVRHRFERHHWVALGFLSLVETANLGTKPDRKVGRFHERPAQILIPVLGVAAAFAFAVGKFLAAHTPAVRKRSYPP